MSAVRTLIARIGESSFGLIAEPDGRVVVTPDHGSPHEARVHYLGHGRVEVVGDQGRRLAYVVEDEATRWVFLDGRVFEVMLDDAARPARRPRRAGHEELTAPMPASVVRVLVTPGQRVERGATLVVLEAMKMELPLKAPHEAIVAAVRCAEGELVQPGTALVELDVVPEGPEA
jgi:biotin carboxyl carrier protein